MGHLSIRQYITEATLNDISDYEMPSFTKARRLPQQAYTLRSAKLDADQGVLTLEVDSAVKYGKWKDRPNYVPRSVNLNGGTEDRNVDTYDVTVWWPNWVNDLDDIEYDIDTSASEEAQLDDIVDYLFDEADVKLHCTCPGFHWNGIKRKIKPYKVPIDGKAHPSGDGSKLDSIDVEQPLCKHLYSFVGKAKNALGYAIMKSGLKGRFNLGGGE